MTRAGKLSLAAFTVLVCLLAPRMAIAQLGNSTLSGQVTDAQGAGVPGATVTVTNKGTSALRTMPTNENGSYRFVSLPPGTYDLRVEMDGFRTAVRQGVELRVDSPTELDLSLVVGALAETVQVTAETKALNTSDGSLGNVISGTQIRELPLEGRNVVGLLALQPGVVYIPKANASTTNDPRYGSVSGSRADQSNVTLDGIDVNDSQNQNAFTSVLRVTLDAVQEFRVTTSNYGADQGRSSGAQVTLVTRSGTNAFSGAGYYVNRDTKFSANEYFLKLSQLAQGNPSEPPLLNKHIFGGAVGGPIKRDRLFFFGNFEGLNEQRENSVERALPSNSFRDGVLIYQCAVASACPGGSVRGFANNHSVAPGFYGLTPGELARIDPLKIGASRLVSEQFNRYPSSNTPGRDGRNIVGFRFGAPIDNEFRTYIARFDYRASQNDTFFSRLNFQDDVELDAAQYPGTPSTNTELTKNKGVALGWDRVLGPNKINTFRYGYTLIDSTNAGLQTDNVVDFRFIDDFDAATSTNGRKLGTHNIVNDFSWIKGEHTFKFGTNLRWVRNDRFTNSGSFHGGSLNGSWVAGVGRRYMPGGTCPAPADCSGLPAVAGSDQAVYADSFINLLGIVSQTTARWNYALDGTVLPVGEPLRRLYAADEYEFYMQDSWKLRDDLTVSAGLRYSLYSPPYEANGIQVAPSVDLGEWFEQRGANAARGIPSSASERITFNPGGPVNDAPGFYSWDKNNFAPRVSAAWTPTPRLVLRGGYSMVYDRVGAGIASSFDAGGSFGLSTSLSSPVNQFNETNPLIRFQGINVIPASLRPAPPGGYPATPPLGAGVITTSLDSSIITPYSHIFNLVAGFELGPSYSLEAAYVGRRGRNLLVRRDLAMPANIVDPKSGMDYFTAVGLLINNSANGVAGMAPIAYWENMFPGAAGGGLTATQAMAESFQSYAPDYITALYDADQFCSPGCPVTGEFTFFTEQYDALSAQSSIGRSEYDALQLTLRKRFSRGHQFDFNYTFARAKDHGSEVERGGTYGNFGSGGYSGFLVNSWDPDLNYSYADFDVRHQINVNGLYELPFGEGRKFGGGAGPVLNAIIGDWSLAGIFRWTSGFPFNVQNCRSCWATNWNVQGNAALANPDVLPELETTKNAVGGQPSPFANATEAAKAFRRILPGETGIRNLLRGDGYFGIDASIGKSFSMPFGDRLRFRWDVFNMTNTVRFDTGDVTMTPDIGSTFGRYNGALTTCDGAAGRCMQLNLRYEF
jgi:hypothetical protein